MLWHRQALYESKGDKLSSSAGFKLIRVSDTKSPAQTRQPATMISEHSAHSTPQPFGIRTWLWRYTYLLLLISIIWHRQAMLESKGDKLSSSADCRIRTHQGLRHQIASRLNARWQTDWALENQAKTWTRQPVPMISEQSAHSTLQPFGIRTWLWRYTCLLLLISKPWDR